MLSRADIRHLQSLQTKRYRKEHQLFLAEGEKIVQELLDHKYPVNAIYAVDSWDVNTDLTVHRISEEELKKISSLSTPNKVIALCPQRSISPSSIKFDEWIFAVDDLQDPGNLGTIIRIADWFGISTLVCSNNSVDLYNPKVIQATMGSFIGVDVIYTDLSEFLDQAKEQGATVYGTTLEGTSLYDERPASGIVVFGNESSGISPGIKEKLTKEILIPSSGKPVAESLNVAVSAAAVASFIRSLR